MNQKDQDVGTALVGAPACGDALKLQIRVGKDGRITDAKFRAFGCPAAVASSSLATVMLKGKTLDEALKIKNTVIANELKLPPVKVHCSMLAQDAIQQAVKSYRSKNPEQIIGNEAIGLARDTYWEKVEREAVKKMRTNKN